MAFGHGAFSDRGFNADLPAPSHHPEDGPKPATLEQARKTVDQTADVIEQQQGVNQ